MPVSVLALCGPGVTLHVVEGGADGAAMVKDAGRSGNGTAGVALITGIR